MCISNLAAFATDNVPVIPSERTDKPYYWDMSAMRMGHIWVRTDMPQATQPQTDISNAHSSQNRFPFPLLLKTGVSFRNEEFFAHKITK